MHVVNDNFYSLAETSNGSFEQSDILSSASSSMKPNELIRSEGASKKPDKHGKILWEWKL